MKRPRAASRSARIGVVLPSIAALAAPATAALGVAPPWSNWQPVPGSTAPVSK
ncbi:MAG TPA: hypothetical protein VMV08_10605 [Gaiellaceae bacterium]|nr:hypothetical protein [Gaiellaceae bacterium]